MKIRLFFLISICGILCASNAYCRIGETEAESEARYGKPVPYNAENIKPVFEELRELRYRFNDWRVRCVFMDGKTELITYMKIEQPVSREALLLQNDVNAILEAEAQDGKWTEVDDSANLTESARFSQIFKEAKSVWQNSNGSIAWVRGDYAISIISPAAQEYAVSQEK